MFPKLYQTHLTTQLNKAQYLMLSILVQLLQSYRWVRLEELANKFPQPILFESRRKKLQRFLDLPIYFELLDHVGNSDLETQTAILGRVLPVLKGYKKVVLGDR